jgi:hypothetical protein
MSEYSPTSMWGLGEKLDDNQKATTGKAGGIINSTATIDVMGNLTLNAQLLQNKDAYGQSVNTTEEKLHIVYGKFDQANPDYDTFDFSNGKYDDHGGGARYCNATDCPTDEEWNLLYASPQSVGDPTNATYVSVAGTWNNNDASKKLTTYEGQVFDNYRWNIHFVHQTVTTTGEIGKDPAKILVGGNMVMNADSAINDKSQIIVGQNLTGKLDNLQNIGASGSITTTKYDRMYRNIEVDGKRTMTELSRFEFSPVSDNWSTPAEVKTNTATGSTGTIINNRVNNVVTAYKANLGALNGTLSPSVVGAVTAYKPNLTNIKTPEAK